VKTLIARLGLMAAGEPEGDTVPDIAFSLYTAWAQHCLSLAEQDKLLGFPMLENSNGKSPEELKDEAFEVHLKDAEAMSDFVETSCKQLEVDSTKVLREIGKYVRVTGRDS